MLVRQCAGGVVFYKDKAFLLKNDKGEWVLPKGVIRNGKISSEVAISRVRYEGGVDAKIIHSVGETNYEFFSNSRRCPVRNQVKWFLMEAVNDNFSFNKMEGFTDGGFFSIDEALDMITYSQDKALVNLAYKQYQSFLEETK